MFLYRVAVKRSAYDLSGRGAQQFGGRWNPKGMAALYTAESPAQALLEYLPHFSDTCPPPDLMLVTLWFPESLSVLELTEDKIPAEWAFRPFHSSTIHIGRTWLNNQATVALRVTSVMLPYGKAWNIILNPAHLDYATGKLVEVAPLPFDPRLAEKLVKT